MDRLLNYFCMTKKGKNELRTKFVIFLITAVALLLLGGLLKNNFLPSSSSPQTGYQAYQDPTYGFTIAYPKAWEIRKDTQVFENGDAVAFRKTGPTQKERTELTDGVQVAIAQPFTITSDLSTWVKEYFDKQAEFSQNTINDRTYQKVYTCGLGCMTFYYTLVNNKVFGVAVFAQGADKMVYNNAVVYMLKSLQFNSTPNEKVTKEEVIAKVRALPEVKEYLTRVPKGLVSINGEEDATYMVQVYEVKDEHTATFNWYTVNKATGEVEKEF